MQARVREGTTGQKALLIGLLSIYALAVLIGFGAKVRTLGQPDLGWHLQWNQISPTRRDAAQAGLRGGGQVLAINGVELQGRSIRREILPLIRSELGESNSLTIVSPGRRTPREVTVEVRTRRFEDSVYAEGATMALGLLFFVVGLSTFVLRPWKISSWALLSLSTFMGGTLWTLFPEMFGTPVEEAFHRAIIGMDFAAIVHASLAFPVVHPVLLGGRGALVAIYGGGLATSVAQLHAWQSDWQGVWQYVGAIDVTLLLVAILYFVGRCAVLAVRSEGLIAQRSRILLAGALFGGAVPVAVRFVQISFGQFYLDVRWATWSLAILLWALARVTLRSELLNARVAVRRAAIYGMTVIALTALAMILSALSPYLVAILLLPLLYLWPRFEARLNERFYPKRYQLPQLVREVSEELARTTTVKEVLEALSSGAARVLDARSGAAFLFAGVYGPTEQVGAFGDLDVAADPPLEKEPLLQVMVATRNEIKREQISVEPQYARIRAECYELLDRLDADLILPMIIEDRVVGGVALGQKLTGDPYEGFEISVLSALTQGAVQDMRRIGANQRLHERELEFSELKRFFPQRIIEQVMAKGGVAELRSQRRRVTVFFADLRGFTSFAERSEPEEVMATLATYHDAMGARISEYQGTLERFVGDGFMVFFNDPVDQPDHVKRAARMALAMLGDVEGLRSEWSRRGYGIDVGMGIATGYATVGFIGYEDRRDYAVIGSVTNLASRLSDLAAPGEILVTGGGHAELADGFATEPGGEYELAGFSQRQPAYRLLPR